MKKNQKYFDFKINEDETLLIEQNKQGLRDPASPPLHILPQPILINIILQNPQPILHYIQIYNHPNS